MRNFRKVLVSLISLVCICSLVSFAVIEPYYNSESFYYLDKRVREDLAGKIDYLIIGSSHGLAAFKPVILDEGLNCNSYNLSGGMMTFGARYYLLKKELERNPVKTVVIEVSHNALTSANDDGYGEGDSAFLPRLDSFGERMNYLSSYVNVNEWLNVYAKVFIQGLSYVKYHEVHAVDYTAKGYHPKKTVDISLNDNAILARYNRSEIDTNFTQNNIDYLKAMVNLCKKQGTEVIIAVTPIADAALWQANNMDVFENWLKAFSEENDCKYYNFNLLKNRYDLFSDSKSFFDGAHLSDEGADVFSRAYCDIIQRDNNGNDISDLFFDDYETLKGHSPYMDYYIKQNN